MRYQIVYTIGGVQETDNLEEAKTAARNAIGGAEIVDTEVSRKKKNQTDTEE